VGGTLPPCGAPPPHYDQNEDEAFRVLEGRVAFLVNGAWYEVGPGGPDMSRIIEIGAEHGIHFVQ
jgi:uncharacterized cupin superfamily protein